MSFSILLRVLKSWYFALIVTIVIGVAPFLITLNEKLPSYSVSNEKSIADNGDLNKDFRFFWKQNELTQIKQVYVTIWNDGKTFIDFSDFTKNSPIILRPINHNVVIHDVKIVEKSRHSLNIKYNIISQDSTEAILFDFVGDDALEKNDGCKVRITYSADSLINWGFIGRVKGAKNGNGFEKIILSEQVKTSITSIVSLILFFILLSRIVISLWKLNAVVLKNWEIVFVLCYVIYLYIIPFLFTNSRVFIWEIMK